MRNKLLAALGAMIVAFVLAVPSARADTLDFTGVGGSWGYDAGTSTLYIATGSISLLGVDGLPIGGLSSTNGVIGIFVLSSPTDGSGALAVAPADYSLYGGSVLGTCSGDCFDGSFSSSNWPNLASGGLFTVDYLSGALDAGFLSDLGLGWGNDLSGYFALTLGSGGACDPEGLFPNMTTCGTVGSLDLQVQPVPEPGTLALLGTGLLGMAGFLRRRFSF